MNKAQKYVRGPKYNQTRFVSCIAMSDDTHTNGVQTVMLVIIHAVESIRLLSTVKTTEGQGSNSLVTG